MPSLRPLNVIVVCVILFGVQACNAGETQEIVEYVQSLGTIPYSPEGIVGENLPDQETYLDGVAYTLRNQVVTVTRNVNNVQLINPNQDAIWPGSLIQGTSIPSGNLAPILLARAPGTITLTTDLNLPTGDDAVSLSRAINSPSLENVTDARLNMLRELNPGGGPGNVEYFFGSARTVESGFTRLGAQASGIGWDFELSGSLSSNLTQNSIVVQFKQTYYTVAFVPDGSPARFFADAVRLSEVQTYAGEDNPPTYISQVTYGRQLFIVMTSSASEQDMQAAFNFSVSGGAASGSGEAEARLRRIFDSSSIRVISIGGNGRATIDLLTNPVDLLDDYLRAGSEFSLQSPGVPIEMTLRHLSDLSNVTLSLTTRYEETFDAYAEAVQGDYDVGEGETWGGNLNTGIHVAAGDHVSINATGMVWAGVVATGEHGPNGWPDWFPGQGSGWPLPNSNAHILMARIGGVANGWRPIGTGDEFTAASTGALWLGINDPDPYNGSGHFDVTVTVLRRTKEEQGLFAVNDTAQ